MLISFELLYLSCLAFSLSLNRHFEQLFPKQKLSPASVKALRLFAWAMLVSGAVYLSYSQGIATGLVLLCGLFSLASLTIAFIQHYFPRILIGLAFIFLISIFPGFLFL